MIIHESTHPSCAYLSGVEVDKAVAPRLSLQRPGLMEQEVKLFHIAKLLQQLHQVIPAEWKGAQISNGRDGVGTR